MHRLKTNNQFEMELPEAICSWEKKTAFNEDHKDDAIVDHSVSSFSNSTESSESESVEASSDRILNSELQG